MDALLIIVLAAIVLQVAIVRWAHWRMDRRIDQAEREFREARRKQAELIEQATRDTGDQ